MNKSIINQQTIKSILTKSNSINRFNSSTFNYNYNKKRFYSTSPNNNNNLDKPKTANNTGTVLAGVVGLIGISFLLGNVLVSYN